MKLQLKGANTDNAYNTSNIMYKK